ncbi:hypothetical protein ABW21_db0200011 [Orbilia brochopaga]|nr:hypothetical protein ABW21_db0200011 [Drechslerella brochopaga]
MVDVEGGEIPDPLPRTIHSKRIQRSNLLHRLLWNKDADDPLLRYQIFRKFQLNVPEFTEDHCYKDDGSYYNENSTNPSVIPPKLTFLSSDKLAAQFSGLEGTRIATTEIIQMDITPLVQGLDPSVQPRKLLPCGRTMLLIRNEYEKLKEELEMRQKQYEAKKVLLQRTSSAGFPAPDRPLGHHRNIIISGNPGIGLVTVYGSYNSRHTIFTPEGAHAIEDFEKDSIVKKYADDSSVWYLSDAIPNDAIAIEELADWMVIQASPPSNSESKFGAWQKQKGIPVWYMDVWSWREIYSIT